jgi:hypothetical protein
MKKGTHFSPEQSERASQAQIERWAVPGARERQKGWHFSPEQSERARQAQLDRWAIPGAREQRAAMTAASWTPERRRSHSVTTKNRFAAMDETELEQFRKSVSEGQTLAWKKPSEARKQVADLNRQVWAEHRAKVKSAAKPAKHGGGRPPEDAKAEMIHDLRTRTPQVKWDDVLTIVVSSWGHIGLSACKNLYARWLKRAGRQSVEFSNLK